MFETTHNWELFGFDLRLIGRQWRSAWREFLWGSTSPVLARLDETVRVRSGEDLQYYYAGRQLHPVGPVVVACDAILLPADLVLSKTLRLPLAVEADLDAVMALEVGAHNPFPPSDTVSGWAIIRKTDDHLSIGLAIASASSVMTFLAEQHNCLNAMAYEVWTCIDDTVVVLEGFGEAGRRQRYRRRLAKIAAMIGLNALLVLAIVGTFAATKHFELLQYEEMSKTIQREASGAMQARQSLLAATETISAINKYVAEYPNPHVEFARLTRLMGDSASLISFNMTGTHLQLRGRAIDAAAVVQELTEESAYVKVTSPQAITKLGDSGFEEFYLDIELAQGSAQ
jgi:general secretion pathway protein L